MSQRQKEVVLKILQAQHKIQLSEQSGGGPSDKPPDAESKTEPKQDQKSVETEESKKKGKRNKKKNRRAHKQADVAKPIVKPDVVPKTGKVIVDDVEEVILLEESATKAEVNLDKSVLRNNFLTKRANEDITDSTVLQLSKNNYPEIEHSLERSNGKTTTNNLKSEVTLSDPSNSSAIISKDNITAKSNGKQAVIVSTV